MDIKSLKFATPISHLFENDLWGKEISSVSDCLEVRQRSLNSNWPNQRLFHIDIDLSHPWNNQTKEYLQNAFELKKDLEVVTFQSTKNCEGEKLENNIFQVDGRIFSKIEMLTFAKENTVWLRSILNDKIKIGLENNNYYPTEAYDIVTDGDFLTEMICENNLFLLLDIAHALVTAHNKNINYMDYLSTFPMEELLQIHICKPELPKVGTAFDAHNLPDSDMENMVLGLIKEYPQIKYLTVEYYKDKDLLIDSIESLKRILINN
jgi:hypothetical protein